MLKKALFPDDYTQYGIIDESPRQELEDETNEFKDENHERPICNILEFGKLRRKPCE